MKATQINILADRPQVPEGWIIFNAPRPIYGNMDWRGDFKEGVFYTAVDPSDSLAQTFIRENLLLHAVVCKYVDFPQMLAWAKEYCETNGYNVYELDPNEVRMMFFSENGTAQIELNA